jgi:flagellar motor switch protein FliN/FliY
MSAVPFIDQLVDRLATVIESMTGTSCRADIGVGTEIIDPGLSWWRQAFNAGPDALIWIGGSKETCQEIARTVLGAAGIENPAAEDLDGTYQELLNQSLLSFASGLSIEVRREIACTEGRNADPPGSGEFHSITLDFGPSLNQLYVVIHPNFAKCLEAGEEHNSKTRRGQTQSAAQSPEPPASKTLDLLLDVELPVSVSFGRAQLALRDVVKLTTGSIVELNRAVSEPVEIIVNNCVVARGQVVVVEGNFGVRIQQIMSRQEWLRT